MLAFVVPLKSRAVAGSWSTVCTLLDRTLGSICNQRDGAFGAVVVGHEHPGSIVARRDVSFLEVDFDPPETTGEPDLDYEAREHDKMRKMQVGLGRVGGTGATHVMFVDADDLVSRRLAALACAHPTAAGWYADSGYTYLADVNRLLATRHLHLRTNTSHMVRLDALQPEARAAPETLRRGGTVLYHVDTLSGLSERGVLLEPLPFRGVVYVTHNTENMWWDPGAMLGDDRGGLRGRARAGGRRVSQVLRRRRISRARRSEFGLPMA